MSARSRILPGITTLALAGAAIALTACGSSAARSTSTAQTGTSTSTAKTTDAAGNFNSCSVVTQAEAANAIGQAVTPGTLGHATVEGGLACVFYGSSAPSPRTPDVAQPDSVRVVVVKGPDALTWYNDYKSKVNAQPVTGYGDKAYYDGYASFNILDGDYYIRIAVSPAGTPPSPSDEGKLATAILAKL
jgi:hypothetical protein